MFSFSNIRGLLTDLAYRLHVCMLRLSVMSDSVTPCTVACQAPLSMGFPSKEHWSGLPCALPGYLPYPRIEPTFLVSPALAEDSAMDTLPLSHHRFYTISQKVYTSQGEGNGNPFQCSCLVNPRDWGSLVGCRLWGRTESDTIEVTQQQQQQHILVICSK